MVENPENFVRLSGDPMVSALPAPTLRLPPALNITSNWAQAVERVIRQSYAADDLQYALTPTVVPQPGGGAAPAMLLVLTAPGPQIGTRIQMFLMGDLATDEEHIEKAAFDLAQQMLGQRSAMLAQALTKP